MDYINAVPRPEYPRPEFVREDWLNLNGQWEFEFDDADRGLNERWFTGRTLGGSITVPFCYQSMASGVNLPNEEHAVLWYARGFTIPEEYRGKRLLLQFGAVDYQTQVWVDGQFAGGHTGGYTPFSVDIAHCLNDGDTHRLSVRVTDTNSCIQPRGKQTWKGKPFTCWYPPVSGIWQTVWLEPLNRQSIKRARITPDVDHSRVLFEIALERPSQGGEMNIEVAFDAETPDAVQRCQVSVSRGAALIRVPFTIGEPCKVDNLHYWTPETPNLYQCRLMLRENGSETDRVACYFGMRKIDVREGQIRLNNAPIEQRLVLDQGYWSEGILTAPSDEAIRRDIELCKAMGFNGARKHQKIEDPRYYYWADKLGLLVWGELPSAYEFCSAEVEELAQTAREFVARDYNHPCIVCWVPLNESWGVRNIGEDQAQQTCALSLYHLMHALDDTRLVSTNDGWEQVESDLCSIHDYTAWANELMPRYASAETLVSANGSRMLYAKGYRYAGQPVVISEYGGIAMAQDRKDEDWGYNAIETDEESFLRRFYDITEGFRSIPYVQGFCYTQLTDVYQEINGLLNFDRSPKVSIEAIRKIIARQ